MSMVKLKDTSIIEVLESSQAQQVDRLNSNDFHSNKESEWTYVYYKIMHLLKSY